MSKPVSMHLVAIISAVTMFLAALNGDTAATVTALGSWLIFKEFCK